MTIKDLESLYDYNEWANKRLFTVISQLTPEQFTQSVGGELWLNPQHSGPRHERGMGLA